MWRPPRQPLRFRSPCPHRRDDATDRDLPSEDLPQRGPELLYVNPAGGEVRHQHVDELPELEVPTLLEARLRLGDREAGLDVLHDQRRHLGVGRVGALARLLPVTPASLAPLPPLRGGVSALRSLPPCPAPLPRIAVAESPRDAPAGRRSLAHRPST